LKNLASYLVILIAGFILYFVGAKFVGSSSNVSTVPVRKKNVDPAAETYKQFTEYRAQYNYSLAKKLSTGDALKKLLKEKAWNRTGGSDLEVLFISTTFKKVRNRPTGAPARKSYTITEERLINNNPDTPGLKSRKKIRHDHTVSMIRVDGAWLVSEYEDKVVAR
jgi:hypothetical protein